MYTVEFLEVLKESEEILRFETFDQEDAYRLGTILRQIGMAGEQPVAVRVVLDGLTVYQSFPNGYHGRKRLVDGSEAGNRDRQSNQFFACVGRA